MNETVLITGISSGLGRGLADAYLDRGAKVLGCSRRTPEDLIDRGVRHVSVDLAAGESGARAIKGLLDGLGRIDVVYLNAGKLGTIRDMRDSDLDDLRETMEINVWANKWLLDTLFESVAEVDEVVGISSGAAQSGSRGWNGYSLSKAALNMLIKLYAGERKDTHFVALAPGLVDTAMQDYLCDLPADERYATLGRLREARGTDAMPSAAECARQLIARRAEFRQLESGTYADIRKL